MTTDKAKTPEKARQQVIDSERAFGKSMADRNIQDFASWLSEEAIFFTTSTPLRGKQEIVEYWSRFFVSDDAPFSWEPEIVEVIDTGNLALSSGPVYDPEGKLGGIFNSIWRLEAPNKWRVLFDKGSPAPVAKQ